MYHKQMFLHDPENGVYGDCARTVIANILGLEPSQVPHFMDGDPTAEEFRERRTSFLKEKGFGLVEFPVSCETFEGCVRDIGPNWMPGVRYMLSGTSPRGTAHVVIVDGDEVHDPAIPGGDLVGPMSDGYWWVEVLVPLSVHGITNA